MTARVQIGWWLLECHCESESCMSYTLSGAAEIALSALDKPNGENAKSMKPEVIHETIDTT